MPSVWLSYSWLDNADDDVIYIAQQLRASNLDVKLDRWNIEAGKRLWTQIENFIQNPQESDAWIIYATQNSLTSERCLEELSYALERALNVRGSTYPIIGLFPSTTERELIPASIRARLYVSLTDPEWKERIVAAAQGRKPTFNASQVQPFHHRIYMPQNTGDKFVIEVRPRAGTWSPFFAGVNLSEKTTTDISILHGPAGRLPAGGVLYNSGSGDDNSNRFWLVFAGNEATPTQSYYVFCKALPSTLVFGVLDGISYTLSFT